MGNLKADQNRLPQEPVTCQAEGDTEMAAKSTNRLLYKLMLAALRIIPMLLALIAMLNMLFDFFGIDSGILSMIGGISLLPLLFLYLVSFVFQFCVYHRMFLHYILVNNILTWFDYYIGIPVSNEFLFGMHVFVVGLFLFLVLYFYRKEKCCKR